MWHLVAIIAGIIGLLHFLNPSNSHWHDKKKNDKAGRAVPEAMMSNSNGIHESHARTNLSETRTIKPGKRRVKKEAVTRCVNYSNLGSNPDAFDALDWRNPTIMGNVMGALTDPNTHLIGIYGSDDEAKNALIQRVDSRIQRDQLFGMVVTASVTKRLGVSKIQDDIAAKLGFAFNRSKANRAKELTRCIKNKQSMLIVLHDVYKGFNLGEVGIPYGADHKGIKILLTSTTEDVLSSNPIRTQINFMV